MLALLFLAPLACAKAEEVIEADVCVYGGTASGVAAAVQTARMGKTAVVAEFGNYLGGLTSGGLGATDIGNKAAIGGIAREFYHRIALHYANSNAWRFEPREEYFATRGGPSTLNELNSIDATMWTFEPHVAEDILFRMLNETKVAVYFQQRLVSVKKEGGRISEIVMESGKTYRAAMFVDATYEGDLMAKAKVSYTVGREGNAKHNETLNGVRAETPKHQFSVAVDPYLKPGDAGSGLLPFIQPGDAGKPGEGDTVIGDYCNIAHAAVIHCKKIGNNVMIGINATILHNAEIGNFCLIGAACLVMENMKIPDYSFVVGVPGKIRGKVPQDQMFWLDKVPLEYAELGKRYKAEGL